jgi:hypothetical protein
LTTVHGDVVDVIGADFADASGDLTAEPRQAVTGTVH